MASASDPMRPLVIGLGNESRGDDAVGLSVLRTLRTMLTPGECELVELRGEAFELLEVWRSRSDVHIVDAVVAADKEPGTIVELDLLRDVVPRASGHGSSHAFGVAEAVDLGRAMDSMPDSLAFHGIVVETWVHGAPLSSPVAASAAKLAKNLANRLTLHK